MVFIIEAKKRVGVDLLHFFERVDTGRGLYIEDRDGHENMQIFSIIQRKRINSWPSPILHLAISLSEVRSASMFYSSFPQGVSDRYLFGFF